MALREAFCALRQSDPSRWNGLLREHGFDLDADDFDCMRNLEGDWRRCPLFKERPTATLGGSPHPDSDGDDSDDDVPRNEHGYPLLR